jgi:predicted deacylase
MTKYTTFDTGMIKGEVFDTGMPGPRLLVLGAVHGDEHCGTEGINRIIPELGREDIKLLNGKVVFVPICNLEAFMRNVRYVESNLNRDMVVTQFPKTHEQEIANHLVPLIESCDVLLDLHSYHRGGAPFAIINEAAPRYTQYAASLNSSWIISGWTKAYLASAPKNFERSPTEHIGTTECAYYKGALDVTLECGQHLDPLAPNVAYEGIVRALGHLGMAENFLPPAQMPQVAEMSRVFYSDGDGQFAKNWTHLEFVQAGTLIAKRSNGENISIEKDGVVILPRPDAPKGDEWFYLGHALPLSSGPQ